MLPDSIHPCSCYLAGNERVGSGLRYPANSTRLLTLNPFSAEASPRQQLSPARLHGPVRWMHFSVPWCPEGRGRLTRCLAHLMGRIVMAHFSQRGGGGVLGDGLPETGLARLQGKAAASAASLAVSGSPRSGESPESAARGQGCGCQLVFRAPKRGSEKCLLSHGAKEQPHKGENPLQTRWAISSRDAGQERQDANHRHSLLERSECTT